MAELRATDPVAPAGSDPTEWLALVHVEVESRDSTTDVERRLPKYFRHLRDKYGKPVLPVVVYLKVSLGGIGVHQIVDSCLGFPVDTFRYFDLALPGLDAREYALGDNWLGVVWSALMRVPKGQRLAYGIEALRRIGDAPLTEFERDRPGDCVEAYIDLPEEEVRRFHAILEANATGRLPPMNKTPVQLAEERGVEKGIEQGVEQDELRALRAAVGEAYEARFGDVPAARTRLVLGIEDPTVLRQLLRAVVVAAGDAAARAAFGAQP